ncbi:MAG: type II and III secretion system protein family protein [Limnobacter sp.]|nr:type II and III secretion system protein family protein [Limnobacter sp.]
MKTNLSVLAAALLSIGVWSGASVAKTITLPGTIEHTTPQTQRSPKPEPAPAPVAAPKPSPAPTQVAAPAPPPPKPAARQAVADSPSDSDREFTMAQKEPVVITLSTGFQKIISLPKVPSRVAIGDPTIASVNVLKPTGRGGSGAGVLVTGLKTGSTSLLIWDRGASQARSVTISVTGKAAEALSGLGGINADNDGRVQKLDGVASDIGIYQQARESLLRGDGSTSNTELIDTAVIETSGTVQVDVKVVEFTRSELQNLGINLGRSIGSSQGFSYSITGPAGTTTSTFSTGADINGNSITTNGSVANAFSLALGGLSDDITLAMDILQSNGYARILAEPSLIAQSGQEASFLAGGEIPIPVPGNNGSIAIEFKKFGVGLTFKPTILSNRTIALNVAPEVSDLDFSRGTSIGGILVPALLTRRASTTVELGEGQSFVIGGLISRNIIANSGKVPWLADIPILGALFKNKSYNREDKELVITVTPRFVKPRAAEAPTLPLPGQNVGANPGNVWKQLFLPNPNEPVPGFIQ